jgi:hypothetical protein
MPTRFDRLESTEERSSGLASAIRGGVVMTRFAREMQKMQGRTKSSTGPFETPTAEPERQLITPHKRLPKARKTLGKKVRKILRKFLRRFGVARQ